MKWSTDFEVRVLAHTAAILCLMLLPLLAACQGEIRVDDDDVVYVDGLTLREELGKHGGDQTELLLVDPRTEQRFEESHIEGAVSIPLPDAKADDHRLKRAKRIIVYGDEIEDPRAKAMTKKILAYGYSNVRMYRGGLRDWKSNDWPLVTADGN